eukprot:m.121024 g.121024  ORF g.121024 m.121024 type:complete len:87 (+) comp15626_c0_seq1:2058-2318(+)
MLHVQALKLRAFAAETPLSLWDEALQLFETSTRSFLRAASVLVDVANQVTLPSSGRAYYLAEQEQNDQGQIDHRRLLFEMLMGLTN